MHDGACGVATWQRWVCGIKPYARDGSCQARQYGTPESSTGRARTVVSRETWHVCIAIGTVRTKASTLIARLDMYLYRIAKQCARPARESVRTYDIL